MALMKNNSCSLRPWVVGLFITLSFMSCVHAVTPTDDETESPLEETTTETVPNIRTAPRFMLRIHWMARPATCSVDSYRPPALEVIVHVTATRECDSRANCSPLVKLIQEYHINYWKLCDIGYNFLVGGDGSIYEGRGWEKVGMHTKDHNVGTLGIAFIGTFTDHLPSDAQMEAFTRLINVGVETGKISEDYRLYAYGLAFLDSEPVQSAGRALMDDMVYWPHFVEELL